MSCRNCHNSKMPKGCKNNGLCLSGRCNQKTTFDFLANIDVPNNKQGHSFFELSFKNGRKEYYKNSSLDLKMGDKVVIEEKKGFDVGVISLKGELVSVQRKLYRKEISELKILRKATQKDIEIWGKNINKENNTLLSARPIVKKLKLSMKISDVEYQADGKKITFYYIADQRVDFRELIQVLAKKFSSRIQMCQMGVRQESARIGGIGDCGRELCCSTWIKDFRSVNISAARYQQLSLNPEKLTGQCGKLKCCLNYELDMYLSELKKFPDLKSKLIFTEGAWQLQKIDIFSKKLWYSPEKDTNKVIEINLQKAHYIIKQNEKGKTVKLESLLLKKPEKTYYNKLLEEDNITRFDKINI